MTASNLEGRNPLDDQLDAALAKYAAVEPRPGLEARILANLRAQEKSESRIGWWRWAVALVLIVVIVSAIIWRAERHRPEQVVRQAIPQQRTRPQVATNTTNEASSQTGVRKAATQRRRHTPTIAMAETKPKLDQFPSPLPLTEEEKMLATYVGQHYDEAVLIARAREEQLEQYRRQDELEQSRANRP